MEIHPTRRLSALLHYPQTLPQNSSKRPRILFAKNGIISPSIQNGFLSGVNGTAEHIFTTTAIIDNAIQHGSAFAITFLDLQNEFGSVAMV